MVTGKRLFQGEDLTDILASVVKEQPDLSQAPPQLQRLLASCLEKDPKKRLRDIGDVWRLLDDGQAQSQAEAPPQAASLPHADGKKWLWPSIAGLCAIAAIAAVVLWAPWRAAPSRPLRRLVVDLGAGVALRPIANGTVAISPDGTRLAYAARVAGGPIRLFIRRLDQTKAVELPGTDGAQQLFFSPDSQWVGFTSGTKRNKISVEGGAVVSLGDVADAPGGSWAEDGTIVVGGAYTHGLLRFSPAGGAPAKLTDLGGRIGDVLPQILPGGKAVLYTSVPVINVDQLSINVVPLTGGQPKTVARGGTNALYLPTGHLLYVNHSTLFAVPFDLDRLETRGTAVPILDDVEYAPATNEADLSFSRNGTLVYRAGAASAAALTTLEWIDAAGKRLPLLAKPGVYSTPTLSPDGRKVALIVREGGIPDVQVYDPQRDALSKLTFGGGSTAEPIWTPDGRFVVFGTPVGINWTRADGASQPAPLIESKSIQVPFSFTPDGKRLAYETVGSSGAGGVQIFTVPVEEENGQLKAGKPELFIESKFNVGNPEFSPDGHWLAYQTNESGGAQVFVRPFPASKGGKWQISTSGGTNPHWSRTAHEILYRAGNQILAVPYTVNGDTFVPGKPQVRVEKFGGTAWNLAPDGRILAVMPAPGANQPAPAADHTVVFLENFFDYLRQRVPAN
jgi:Tol biopolymer transport system component